MKKQLILTDVGLAEINALLILKVSKIVIYLLFDIKFHFHCFSVVQAFQI